MSGLYSPPRNVLEISAGDVVLYFARLFFLYMGVVTSVRVISDWLARLKKFLALMRTQEKSLD